MTMKVKSNTCPVINLPTNEISVITFEETNHYNKFVHGLNKYMNRKDSKIDGFTHFLDDNYDPIPISQLYPVILDCSILNLNTEKEFTESIVAYFEKLIYEDPNMSMYFQQFQFALDNLVNHLEIYQDNYTIELETTTFNMKKLIKLMNIDIHQKQKDLTHLNLREAYLDFLLGLNKKGKQEVLVIIAPEVNLGTKDIDVFMNRIKSRKITTIVISNNLQVLSSVKYQNVNLIKSNLDLYNIDNLKNELKLFDLLDCIRENEQIIQMAYFDFTKNLVLINEKYKEFLS